jgi:hypothetical protein
MIPKPQIILLENSLRRAEELTLFPRARFAVSLFAILNKTIIVKLSKLGLSFQCCFDLLLYEYESPCN